MPPYSRKKSCEQCRTAKTRCSLTFPQCTRCTARGMNCIYKDVTLPGMGGETNPAQHAYTVLPGIPGVPVGVMETTPFSFNAPPPAISSGSPDRSNSAQISDEAATGNSNKNGGFDDLFGTAMDFARFMPDAYGSHGSNGSSNGNSLSGSSVNFFDQAELEAIAQSNPRLMQSRPTSSIDALLTHKAIHGQLKSWPKMMLEMVLPPYIHPPCWRKGSRECESQGRHVCFSTPLDNAVSVVQMSQTTTRNNFELLRFTGHYEQKRMLSEYESYDKWKLLEAFQTMALYTIMYSALTHEQLATCDASIVPALGVVATKVYRLHGHFCEKEKTGGFPDWEDWIYAESVRRAFATLHIMGRILEMRIGPPPEPGQCEGLDGIPLPACKDLWEAPTRREWERGYQDWLRKKTGKDIRDIGDLRKSRKIPILPQEDPLKTLTMDLDLWCSNLDAFGTLVWMASTMVIE